MQPRTRLAAVLRQVVRAAAAGSYNAYPDSYYTSAVYLDATGLLRVHVTGAPCGG